MKSTTVPHRHPTSGKTGSAGQSPADIGNERVNRELRLHVDGQCFSTFERRLNATPTDGPAKRARPAHGRAIPYPDDSAAPRPRREPPTLRRGSSSPDRSARGPTRRGRPASKRDFCLRSRSLSTPDARRKVDTVPLPVPPAPIAVRSSSVSASSRVAVSSRASAVAVATSSSADAYARAGVTASRTSPRARSRRSQAEGSVANRRARPTCPPLTDAAHRAVSASMPSLSTRTCAIASTGGVTKATCRHRDRSVMAMSSGSSEGAQSRKTVEAGGSSTTLSSAFAAPSVSRSASSITTTCHRPVLGRRAAICTIARISATPTDKPSGTILRTSPWVPAMVVTQDRHSPQPGWSSDVHCSAAAKHTAAIDRPDPGGPVMSQACVIAPVAVAL